MKISAAAKEYLVEIEVRNFTQKTIRSYRNNLNLFLRYCETEAQIVDIEPKFHKNYHIHSLQEWGGQAFQKWNAGVS